MRDSQQGAPVFVKIEEYKEVLDVLDLIKEKIKDIRSTLNEMNSLRNEEDAELAMWNSAINEIEKKIEGVDRMMYQPEQVW
jgi:peptidoglycan hydrolase CwlO-like protein